MPTPFSRIFLAASLSLPCAFAFFACVTAGHQSVPRPISSEVPADHCRVYLAREDSMPGSIRSVRVFDGDVEIGLLGEREFLVWDRKPVRGACRLIFEGLSLDTQQVESLFDLPREPGTTSYFTIRITQAERKPEVARLSEEDGRALIADRSPAELE